MRTYNSVNQAWEATLRALLKKGERLDSRNGDSMEMRCYTLRLTSKGVQRNVLLNARRRISPAFMVAEFLWYMSGSSNAAMLLPYAPKYVDFCDPGTTHAYGAYGPRMLGLFKILDHVRDNPNTRRAVMVLWRPEDMTKANLDSRRDIPCTVDLRFLVRNGMLETHVSMRSQDAWLGMPYDLFSFTMIHRLAAEYLSVPAGPLYHHVTSMHLYGKHETAAREALEVIREDDRTLQLGPIGDEQVTGALGIEKRLREGQLIADGYLRDYFSALAWPLLVHWKYDVDSVLGLSPQLDPRLDVMVQAVHYHANKEPVS
jgi:thymidylate synthase